jgi:hypothetical protein
MSTTTLTEHTVTVAGKPIFVAEAGNGAPVVMLHGGGPGASGVSNYSRITFGSDWPYAPTAAGKLFAAGLETYPGIDTDTRAAIERTNALALFPRLGAAPQPISQSPAQRVRHTVSRSVLRGVARLTSTR